MKIDPTARTYSVFDVVVQSPFIFPELRTSNAQSVDIIFDIGTAGDRSVELDCFYRAFSDDHGTQIAFSIAHEDRGYRLRFPALADFLISDSGCRVVCEPVEDIPLETIRHLFVDQVLPRLLGQRGDLVLHASSVIAPNGKGIAFAGKSGWGKSTLASGFKEGAGRLLGDDSLKLLIHDGEPIGVPAYAGARLWDDSINALYPDGIDTGPISHYSGKRRIILLNSA